MSFNHVLFEYLNSAAGQWVWLDQSIVFAGQWLIWLLLAAAFLWGTRRSLSARRFALVDMLAATVVSFAVTHLIRMVYPVPRPFVHHDVTVLFAHDSVLGFPSGHAAVAFAVAFVVAWHSKIAGSVLAAAAALVALARVVAGIHWPADALGGVVLGAVASLVVVRGRLLLTKLQ